MNITKTELFIQAHIIAKASRNNFTSYNGAFSVALIFIYAEQRAIKANENDAKKQKSSIQLEQQQDAARAEAKLKKDAEQIAIKANEKRLAELNIQIEKNEKEMAIWESVNEVQETKKEIEEIKAQMVKPSHVIVHWSESRVFGSDEEVIYNFQEFEEMAKAAALDNGHVKDNGYCKTKVTVYFDDEERSSYGCRLDLALGDEVGFQDHMQQMIAAENKPCMEWYKENIAFAKQIDYSNKMTPSIGA